MPYYDVLITKTYGDYGVLTTPIEHFQVHANNRTEAIQEATAKMRQYNIEDDYDFVSITEHATDLN